MKKNGKHDMAKNKWYFRITNRFGLKDWKCNKDFELLSFHLYEGYEKIIVIFNVYLVWYRKLYEEQQKEKE